MSYPSARIGGEAPARCCEHPAEALPILDERTDMTQATTNTAQPKKTGTVYALVDPRDGTERYIGATKKTLKQRLSGHMKGAQTAPAVRNWITELDGCGGLAPEIRPIAEDVPEADLAYRETQEITIRLGAGLPLLNKVSTVPGRQLLERRRRTQREALEREAWAALVEPIRDRLGGPLPPKVHCLVPVPRVVWSFVGHPDRDVLEQMRPWTLDASVQKRYSVLSRMRADAQKHLGHETDVAWGGLFAVSGDEIARARLRRLVDAAVAESRWDNPESLSTYLTLLPWCMVMVGPWRKLASNAGIADSTEEFIDWVSGDAAVRVALRTVASCGRFGEVTDEVRHFADRVKPSIALASVAAAHLRLTPGDAIREPIRQVLIALAEDRQATEPMADLLQAIDPRAVSSVYGSDNAAAFDAKLGLPEGTSGAVIRELAAEYGAFYPPLRRIAIRSTGMIPTTDRPDYEGWSGPMVPTMHGITATLARAGLLPAPDGYVNECLRLVAVAADALDRRHGRVASVALPLTFPREDGPHAA